MQSPTDALNELLNVAQRVTKSMKKKVNDDLASSSPVDTGEYKSNWEEVDVSKFSWQIYNPTPYGNILAGGRRMGSHGRMIGSLQWRLGIAPMVEDWGNEVVRRFKSELG